MAGNSSFIPGRTSTVAARSRRRDFIELAVAYGLILLVIWTPRPWQRMLWWVAAAAVVAIASISFEGLQAMGLRRENFLRSLWVVGVALLVSAVAVAPCRLAAHAAYSRHSAPLHRDLCGLYPLDLRAATPDAVLLSLAPAALASQRKTRRRRDRGHLRARRICPTPFSRRSHCFGDWPPACSFSATATSTHWPWRTPSWESRSPSRFPGRWTITCAWGWAT